MARPKTPFVELTEPIRPVASVQDTFVRPPPVPRSPMHDVAAALKGLNSNLQGAFDAFGAAAEKNQQVAAEAEFFRINSGGAAQATRDFEASGGERGIPPFASPIFRSAGDKIAGFASGVEFDSRIGQEYANFGGKTSSDPDAFDEWFKSRTSEILGGVPKGQLPTLLPKVREAYTRYYAQWTRDRSQDLIFRQHSLTTAATTRIIDAAVAEGARREGGTDIASLAESIAVVRDGAFASGLERQKVEETVINAVKARAVELKDPRLLSVLDQKRPGEPVALSETEYGRSSIAEARKTIQTLKHQEAERAYTVGIREDAKRKASLTAEYYRRLEKDPKYQPPEEFLLEIEKYDPDFRKDMIANRKAFLEGRVAEDPEERRQVFEDIFKRGEEAVHDGVRSGAIKDPETLTKAMTLAAGVKAEQGKASPILSHPSWQVVENVLKAKGVDPKWKGALNTEQGLTDAGRDALFWARTQMMEWSAKNPNAGPKEREDAIRNIGEAAIKAITPALDLTPSTDQPSFAPPQGEVPQAPAPGQRGDARQAIPSAETLARGLTDGPQPTQPSSAASAPQSAPLAKELEAYRPLIQRFSASPTPPKINEVGFSGDQRSRIEALAKKHGVDPQVVVDRMHANWRKAMQAPRPDGTSPQQAPDGQAPSANPVSPTPGQEAPIGPRSGLGDDGDATPRLAAFTSEDVRSALTAGVEFDLPGVGRVSTKDIPPEALAAIQAALGGGGPRETPTGKAAGTQQQQPQQAAPGMRPSMVNPRRVAQIDRTPVGPIIDRVAGDTGYDAARLKTIVSIESGGNPKARAGSYFGLGQLSKQEFSKYGDGGGDIFNPEANLRATVNSLREKEARFQSEFGREPSVTELYMLHQQGEAGARAHFRNPDQAAWQSMHSTGEGRRKGERWAKLAIWGNVPSDMKARFGSVEEMTSREFLAVWMSKLEGIPYARALARLGGGRQVASLDDNNDDGDRF